MVLSQNTKQYNRRNLSTQSGRSDYSYTFYDALGRIVEVGEKTDNATGTTFAQIFGDYVNGRYNPYVINATNFSSWANAASPAPQRREVTRTYYDVPLSSVPSGVSQENLRKRVSVVSYEEVNDNDPLTYQNATYYSYDIHGNVKTLWQHNKALTAAVPTQVTKRMDYEYDLISGKVNLVRYQDGAPDCFYHYYMYDGDNRVTDVYTSNYPWNGQAINSRFVEKNPLWSKDAKYFYYAHGPLARVEVGEFMSQGMDYAYTLQGWIKGVNSDALTAARDMGRDGDATGANKMVGRDAFGYSLNYYQGDYSAIEATRWSSVPNRFESGRAGSQLFGARADLYNGNISAMVTNISQPKVYSSAGNEFPVYQAQGGAYTYDKLNRIKQAKYYQNLNTTTNQWNTSGLSPARYLNTFVYDGNGNILHQYRLDGGGSQIDSLSYKYSRDANGKLLKNRLNYVRDASTSLPATAADDLENQTSVLNYRYDELGNLSRDSIEQIDTIKWTVYGKIKSIRRMLSSTKSNWEFVYDASGNRIAKIEKPDGTAKENGASDQPLQWKTTYYVRDAQGNVMGNYYYTNPGGSASYKLLERSVYGSARLGTENTQLEMIGAPGPAIPFTRTLGNKYFEASNHLGNVLVIFTDKKIPRNDDGNAIIDYFQPEVLACNDYTAFGAPMNERTFSSNKYRYGFNGKEKDDEVKGNGNQQDYGMRVYDNRLGRFLSVDPLASKYPELTPYQFASNTPIEGTDLDGLEVLHTTVGVGYGLLIAGSDFNTGVAIGPDGLAFTATRSDNIGFTLGGWANVSATLYPTMPSVQGVGGEGYSASASGAFLGKFGVSGSYSSGYYGGGASVGVGVGLSFVGSKSNTAISRTFTWKEIGMMVLKSQLNLSPELMNNVDINKMSADGISTQIFNNYKTGIVKSLDKEIGQRKDKMQSNQKEMDTWNNTLTHLNSQQNLTKEQKEAGKWIQNKLSKLGKENEKLDKEVSQLNTAKENVNNAQPQ